MPEDLSQYAIIELMGHKVVAGLVQKSEMLGTAMLRIDVPATSAYPAFTQFYGNSAIYAITFVSEEVARLTAEHNRVNPVSVYVPELVPADKHREIVEALQENIRILSNRLFLPKGEDPDEGREDYSKEIQF